MKELKRLHLEHWQRRYKDLDLKYYPKPRYTDKNANGLTRCIIDYLRFKGWQAERISSEGRIIDTRKTYTDVIGRTKTIGGIKRVYSSSTNGTADISATIKGRSVKIEVKIGNDRQSEAQKKYQQAIERAGGIYIIAKDFDSFVAWYKAKFEPTEEAGHE